MSINNSSPVAASTYWSLTQTCSHLNSNSVGSEICQKSSLFKVRYLLLLIFGACLDFKKLINVFLLQFLTASLCNLFHHSPKRADESDSSLLFFIILLAIIALEFITLRRHRAIQDTGTYV